MPLILARHGNTFGPEDTPVWVGAAEDYPLVERGLKQAVELADALSRKNWLPDRIIAGPLKRTRQGADIIAEQLGLVNAITIDDRLKEIDYGSWGGRSDSDIINQYGEEALIGWRENSIRPVGADWLPSEEEIEQHAKDVLKEITASEFTNQTILLITSNGTLRYFHRALYSCEETSPPGKVKTGNVCICDFKDGMLIPRHWNIAPTSL